MKQTVFLFILCLMTVACSEEEKFYPSIVTEMADVKADEQGRLAQLLTDDDVEYTISQPIAGYRPGATYRALCGFVPKGKWADVHQLSPVHYLRDSTNSVRHDPTNVYSVWQTRRYLNMHLRPLTQGGQHYWGFAVDSITDQTAHLSLHHDQCGDFTAYSEDVYASLPLDSVPQELHTIRLTIHTFQQDKTWVFVR